MHVTARENIDFCLALFQRALPAAAEARALDLLEVAGAGEPGIADLASGEGAVQWHYQAAVLEGETGQLKATDREGGVLKARSFDVIVISRTLGVSPVFWDSFSDLVQLCRPDGMLLLVEPSSGPVAAPTQERFRFLPGAMRALARWSRTQLAYEWADERGPWRDSIGVFCRDAAVAGTLEAAIKKPVLPDLAGQTLPECRTEDEERCAGERPYLAVLALIHASLAPAFYLEIGVRFGKSARLASCDSLGIDPYPEPLEPLPQHFELAATTSDHWFRTSGPLPAVPDLAFIDGCHWWEYALRDFMHIERNARPGSLIVIDDIYPNNPVQAQRHRETVAWTGDVWKLHDCLARFRPDLWLLPLDTLPTGLLLVSACDPDNRLLWHRYGQLIRDYGKQEYTHPPKDRLARSAAQSPDPARLGQLMKTLGRHREEHDPKVVKAALQAAWTESTAPAQEESP